MFCISKGYTVIQLLSLLFSFIKVKWLLISPKIWFIFSKGEKEDGDVIFPRSLNALVVQVFAWWGFKKHRKPWPSSGKKKVENIHMYSLLGLIQRALLESGGALYRPLLHRRLANTVLQGRTGSFVTAVSIRQRFAYISLGSFKVI